VTRGKRARARHAQQQQSLQEEIHQLQREIQDETVRADQARAGAEQVRAALRQLEDERRATARRLAPHVAEARRRAEGAIRILEQLKSAVRKVRAADREITGGSGDEDSLQQLTQSGVPFTFPGVHSSASAEFTRAWYRKQAGTELPVTHGLSLKGWIPSHVEDTPELFDRYASSMPVDTHPEACWAWAIPPWMRIPTDTTDVPLLREQLGTTTTGAPLLPTTDYPGPGLREDMIFFAPWRHPPLVSHPADALDMLYWYRRSSWVQGWYPESEPVPMWLPGEHSSAFPAGRSLPEDVDVRLPFPSVFAVFATPWRIEPNKDHAHRLLGMHPLYMHARGRLGEDFFPPALGEVLQRLQATGLTHRDDLPSPLEFLDGYGGSVEGVLLTANDQGVPGDEVAWCVAIYHPMGMPIARLAIPASRMRSQWRRPLDNVIAGIALSCWHEAKTLPPRHTGRRQATPGSIGADPGSLHVLDIDATSPRRLHHDTDTALETTVRPHLRRGHWRDQPVGPGRRQRRWTWVRSTTVHGTLTGTSQVYVLRP
jgi:hypothetical protein